MDQQLCFSYDRQADVLYVSKGHPEFTDYVEIDNNVILRLDPTTKQVVGFTIIDFAGRFELKTPPLSVPLKVNFERVTKPRKSKMLAEKRSGYRVKRRASPSHKRSLTK